ncbi:MAG TPA: tetratricopeptide repeat protein, partial [Vicinamibacterales bacterium]|nr:tetratricopeptide repeat protein [Vicinamibacterales bacterium]
MPRESLILGIAGVFFGVLVGWIIGSQQRPSVRPAAADAPAAQQGSRTPPALDEAKASALQTAAGASPQDPAPRIELGNLYFDHERFREAAQWYEEALRVSPKNVNVSTDLGIAYYYMNRPDAALAQFDRSLALDPGHTKTLLNVGIVRAFGKQDLDGAAKAWRRVVELAPESPEAARAR